MADLTAVILGAGKGTRMRSELPKVLHPVDGTPMIVHALTSARAAGVDRVICVIGYGRELLEEALHPLGVETAFQELQLGTGHAVSCAKDLLVDTVGDVLVLYGDMPLLSAETINSLVARRRELDAAAVVLTIELDNPPDFGRIVRDESGAVRRIVEVKDCAPDELAIREVNVGAYCFDNSRLLAALGSLGNNNAQGEYYLTDVVELMVEAGFTVDTVRTDSLEETLGVNDPHALAFAEKLDDIKYAESLYELLDAALNFERESAATT
ncbi:MAG: hypothetical protein RLZZ623_649 [Actinomycetota bacterium]|jgi:bifunctional UDP-N-acetylglucosamine pyrophosphorylase / glucosamine-1-phosphate N-acetyltransferase